MSFTFRLQQQVFRASHIYNVIRNTHRLSVKHGANWDVQRIWVTCNVGSYAECPSGVHFDVGYIDSAHNMNAKEKLTMPVILALHGVPGSHQDFLQLMQPYSEQGYRVILPNLPSFGITSFIDQETQLYFRHTTAEQTNFLVEFLNALNIKKIHLAVGHSVAANPLTMLCANAPKSTVQGALFVCPIHGHKLPVGMEPDWMLDRCGRWWYHGGIRRFLIVQTYKEFVAKRNKVRESNTEEVGAIIQTGYNMDFKVLPSIAMEMCLRKIPLTYCITEGDPLIKAQDSIDYAEILGVTKSAFVKYDSEGIIKEQGTFPSHRFSRGVLLEGKSHNPHKDVEYCEIMHQEIKILLNHLKQSN